MNFFKLTTSLPALMADVAPLTTTRHRWVCDVAEECLLSGLTFPQQSVFSKLPSV